MSYQFSCRCSAWLETDALDNVTCVRCSRKYTVIDDPLSRPIARLSHSAMIERQPEFIERMMTKMERNSEYGRFGAVK